MSDEPGERVMPVPTPYMPPELPTCPATGKVIFVSPEEARIAARQIRRRKGDRVHPYRCDACRRWHVGHADGDKKSR